jgi:hypothetical protein
MANIVVGQVEITSP